MTPAQKHTPPFPWSQKRNGGPVYDANGNLVSFIEHAPEILRRVNMHDELLKTLEASTWYLLNAKIDLETGCTKATAVKTIEGGLTIVRALIAKAKEQP
jgi:hypothetical protein